MQFVPQFLNVIFHSRVQRASFANSFWNALSKDLRSSFKDSYPDLVYLGGSNNPTVKLFMGGEC